MHKSDPLTLPNFWQRSCKPILIFLWIFGLFFGVWLAVGADDSSFLMMRGADLVTVSIPGLLLITVLPFLFTAIAVFLSKPWLLSALVFAKAAMFGYSAGWVTAAYGTASWIVRILLMFSDVCTMPLLMWLWLRCCILSKRSAGRDMGRCFLGATIIGLLDILAVSPFAALLL